jgi:hypothetical protein
MGPIGLTPALSASSVEWRDGSRQWIGKGVEGKRLSWNLRHYPGICLENWGKPQNSALISASLPIFQLGKSHRISKKIWNVFNKILNEAYWSPVFERLQWVPNGMFLHIKKIPVSTTDGYDKYLSLVDTCHVVGTVHLYKHTYWPLMRFLPAVSKCDTSQRNRQRFFNKSRIFATTHLYNLVVWQIFFVAFFRLAQHTGLGLLTDSPTTALSSSRKKKWVEAGTQRFLVPWSKDEEDYDDVIMIMMSLKIFGLRPLIGFNWNRLGPSGGMFWTLKTQAFIAAVTVSS